MTLAKVGEDGGDEGGGGSVMGSCSWGSCFTGVVSPGGIVPASVCQSVCVSNNHELVVRVNGDNSVMWGTDYRMDKI